MCFCLAFLTPVFDSAFCFIYQHLLAALFLQGCENIVLSFLCSLVLYLRPCHAFHPHLSVLLAGCDRPLLLTMHHPSSSFLPAGKCITSISALCCLQATLLAAAFQTIRQLVLRLKAALALTDLTTGLPPQTLAVLRQLTWSVANACLMLSASQGCPTWALEVWAGFWAYVR